MILSYDERLSRSSRFRRLSGERARVGSLELATLLLSGAVGAIAATFVHVIQGVPGHHIVFSVFPMAMGFAMVPRRTAGTVMSGSALATLLLLGLGGAHLPGPGAMTSLLACGPVLDLALRWGRGGVRLYAAFIAAGATANTVAFVVRASTKLLGVGGLGGGRGFASWLPQALWTYALAGIVAGLISAGAWFRLRSRNGERHGTT